MKLSWAKPKNRAQNKILGKSNNCNFIKGSKGRTGTKKQLDRFRYTKSRALC